MKIDTILSTKLSAKLKQWDFYKLRELRSRLTCMGGYPHPTVEILTAQDYRTAQHLIEQVDPVLVVIDLRLPSELGLATHPDIDIQWLQTLMQSKQVQRLSILASLTSDSF